VGLQAAFGSGYFGVRQCKEWNHNGIVELQGTPRNVGVCRLHRHGPFEAQYMQPLTFTGVR
jgi:hypothetical protein